MVKAVLRLGGIVPLEPLPSVWLEGAQLQIDIVEASKSASPFDIDEWARVMEELCADSSVEEEQIMRQAIKQHREQSKGCRLS